VAHSRCAGNNVARRVQNAAAINDAIAGRQAVETQVGGGMATGGSSRLERRTVIMVRRWCSRELPRTGNNVMNIRMVFRYNAVLLAVLTAAAVVLRRRALQRCHHIVVGNGRTRECTTAGWYVAADAVEQQVIRYVTAGVRHVSNRL